jgi:hypothetical protein
MNLKYITHQLTVIDEILLLNLIGLVFLSSWMDYVVVLEHYTVYYQNFYISKSWTAVYNMSIIASVEYNFFRGSTNLVVLCLFIVEFSGSHSRDINTQ